MEKFRRLAFEGMSDELEDPSDDEERQSVEPEAVIEEAGNEDGDRDEDGRNAKRVAGTVDGMLVARRVLGDPFVAGAVAEHRMDDTTILRQALCGTILIFENRRSEKSLTV